MSVTIPTSQTPYAWFHLLTRLTLSGDCKLPNNLLLPERLDHFVMEHMFVHSPHRVSIDSTSPSLVVTIRDCDLYQLSLSIGILSIGIPGTMRRHEIQHIGMKNVCLPQSWTICARSITIHTFEPASSSFNVYDLWADVIELTSMRSVNLGVVFDVPDGCSVVVACEQLTMNGAEMRPDNTLNRIKNVHHDGCPVEFDSDC